jgi:hypothetical protein
MGSFDAIFGFVFGISTRLALSEHEKNDRYFKFLLFT